MSVPNTKFHYHYRRTCMGIKCNLQESNGKNVFPIIVTMGILLEQTYTTSKIITSDP